MCKSNNQLGTNAKNKTTNDDLGIERGYSGNMLECTEEANITKKTPMATTKTEQDSKWWRKDPFDKGPDFETGI